MTQLIDDVFNICPLAPAIHLGGDEVWHLGSGIRSQDRMERGETKGDLYLKHYSFVIDYILRKYPGNYSFLSFSAKIVTFFSFFFWEIENIKKMEYLKI